jgi:hypothetical protein
VNLNFRTVERWAKVIRDVGIIVGVPVIITLGSKLYEQQIAAVKAHSEVLEAQNKFLKETQYDRAAALLDGQKKVFEMERGNLEKQLDGQKKVFEMEREKLEKQLVALKQEGSEKTEEIARLQKQQQGVDQTLQTLTSLQSALADLNAQGQASPSSDQMQRMMMMMMMMMATQQTATPTPTPADAR